jgi:hypothetical protein
MSEADAAADVSFEYVHVESVMERHLNVGFFASCSHFRYTNTETYHMIDQCDDEIAGWSEKGDSFVVKDLDRFASVRPLIG